jgi:hypothetical protein
MDVVDQIEEVEEMEKEEEEEEEVEVVEDLAVDHHVQENLLIHMMFATNAEVNFIEKKVVERLIVEF